MLNFATAVNLLQKGQVIIYPTETFFAIGCLVSKTSALGEIYNIKQREGAKPLPVLAANIEQIKNIATLSASASQLGEKFWPGPLSIVVPALEHLPTEISAGTGKLAVRITSHAAANRLALAAGEAIFASSANFAGCPAVNRVEQLDNKLVPMVHGVYYEPPEPMGGMPSTLVEIVAEHKMRVLRAGAISFEQLSAFGFEIIL